MSGSLISQQVECKNENKIDWEEERRNKIIACFSMWIWYKKNSISGTTFKCNHKKL